jgi:ribose/xylose/arabinose/galactoside ABC-type transport system permease subunit
VSVDPATQAREAQLGERQAEAAADAEVKSVWGRTFGLLGGQVQAVGVLGILIALFLVTGLHNNLFWGTNNLKVLAENMSFVALVGVGTAILIITGNIDLSIGSLLGLTAVLSAIFAKSMPVPLALVLGTLVGGGVGALNGLVVWNVSTSPLIITLGGLTLIEGIVDLITNGEAISGMPASFTSFGNATPLGIPMPVWLFIFVGILGFIFLTFTKTGRHVYAIGGNKEASRAAGINVRRIVIGAFIFNGLLAGLAGVTEASLYGAPDNTFGVGFELSVITAVIVGGVSFTGGEGGIFRALLGAALVQTVGGSIVSFGINPAWSEIVTGAILIVAVSSDHIVHKQRERYQKAMAMREQARIAEERAQSRGQPDSLGIATTTAGESG